MNIHEIISEEKIEEAPAGMLKQMGRKIGAKALGAIGAKGKAAELGGAAEVGDEANELKTAFRGYLGKTGGNIKQVEGPQLAAFLKSKGYPNMHLKGVQGIMTPKQIDQAIMQAAQDAAKADGGGAGTAPGEKPAGAAPGGAASAKEVPDVDGDGKPDTPKGGMEPGPTAKDIQFKPNQEVMWVKDDGKTATATVVGKSFDGDAGKVGVKKGNIKFNVPRDKLLDPKTKKPLAPGQPGTTSDAPAGQSATATEIPAEMQKKIDSLNPEQKKELASLL